MPGKKRKKSRTLDEPRQLLLVLFAAIFTLELVLLAIALGYRSTQSELHSDARVLLSAREMAHKARVKSSDLHQLAAEAVQGADRAALREYERRARTEAADPDHPNSEILSKLREGLRKLQTRAASFVGDEVVRFEAALAETLKQRQTETKALNALRGLFLDTRSEYTIEGPPDPQLAASLLADPDYKKTIRNVQNDFSAFLSALDVRLFAVHKETAKTFRLHFVIVLIAILVAATPVFYFLLLRAMNHSIRALKINARKLTDDLGHSNAELKAAIASREDYRRRLEQAEAGPAPTTGRIIPAPPRPDIVHDIEDPEYDEYLTRLP